MIDFLLGVPGKLKTIADYLTTYWTSARAAKIDNLDGTITSRAPASTAVSNADYTSARAAKLDIIAAQSSVINSIQKGSLLCGGSGFGSATISAVNVSKSVLILSGAGPTGVSSITSSTSLTVYGNYGDTISWQVVEFK